MNFLLTGTKSQVKELIKSLPENINYDVTETVENSILTKYDCVFDLNLDSNPELIRHYYTKLGDTVLVVSAVKSCLAEFQLYMGDNHVQQLIGINALNGFVNRPVKELSFWDVNSKKAFENINKVLKWDIEEVEDRVGMVSPRVILMIINEACYTLQEGTADIASIDQAMKLGTNYPKGPFEWADEIGIEEVYSVLKSIYEDTGDIRYKICPLLKQMFLKKKNFY